VVCTLCNFGHLQFIFSVYLVTGTKKPDISQEGTFRISKKIFFIITTGTLKDGKTQFCGLFFCTHIVSQIAVHTFLKLADHAYAIFKMVRYVLLLPLRPEQNRPTRNTRNIYELKCSSNSCNWSLRNQTLSVDRAAPVAMYVLDSFVDCGH
jgi:hypothetical protein